MLRLIPLPPIINVANAWASFLVQALVFLLFQYVATLSIAEGPDLFRQSEPFQNFQKFFQELAWSQ